jgi:GNAT superfamily N-acetyltransferase
MDEGCRRAAVEDLVAVASLVDEAVAELEPTKGGAVWARREGPALPPDDDLAAALADPETLLAVGTIDDTVVGYVLVRVEHLRDGGRLAVLDAVYVLEGARGVGVGEQMITRVLEWASEQRCIGVDSLALPGNRATKNFFETHGLVARAIVVHRSLER